MYRKDSKTSGKVIVVYVDAQGFAYGEALRTQAWINVPEPLMRWVRLEPTRTKEDVFYDIHHESLPYFCFFHGLFGHAELYRPTPSGRDTQG